MTMATWNFLEAGHGKGPADGIGAVVKRTAGKLVSQGADIKDAASLFENLKSSTLNVETWMVSPEDIAQFDNKCPAEIPAVPGTMKLHQVLTRSSGKIFHRCVSCFCKGSNEVCSCYELFQCTLLSADEAAHDVVQVTPPQMSESVPDTHPMPTGIDPNCLTDELIGRWCVVDYDGLPYPGIIQAIHEEDVEVKVMHRIGNNRFFWPSTVDDILWYVPSKIVSLIPPTKPVTGRHQQIRPDIWNAIVQKMGI